MNHGATVSVGPIAARTIASFARHDREFDDDELVSQERSMQRMHGLSEPAETLTAAQIDALRCIAAGDRFAAAAARLGKTESALQARISSARERLMARTTALAIQRAKDSRVI